MLLSIRYIDSVETETHIYIATERVRPLEGVLRDWETGGALASGAGRAKGKENWIGWGVRSVSVSSSQHFLAPNLAAHAIPSPLLLFSILLLYPNIIPTSFQPLSLSLLPSNGV